MRICNVIRRTARLTHPLFLFLALAAATHALALTSEYPISTQVLRSAPGEQQHPSVASDGESFLAVWKDGRFGGSLYADVYATRIDANGEVLDRSGIPVVPTHTEDADPHVVWNGEEYLVVYSTPYFNLGVTAVRVARDGTITGGRAIVRPRSVFDTALAWNGTNYLVVWRETTTEIRAILLDRDLNAVSAEMSLGAGLAPAAASNGEGFLVAWIDQTITVARAISRSGDVAPLSTIGRSVIGRPAIASDGRSYAIARPSFDSVVVTAVSEAGNVLNETTFQIAAPTFPEVAIAWSGSRYVVAWNERLPTFSNVVAAQIDAALTVVSSPHAIAFGAGSETAPAIGVSRNRVLILWSDIEVEADIRGTFLHGGPEVLVSQGLAPQRMIAAASSGDVHAVLWSEGDTAPRLMFGRVSSSGEALDGPGIDIAPALTANIASNGDVFLVAYEIDRGIAAVRFGRDGALLDRTPIEITGSGRRPVVASNGRDFVVGWEELGVRVAIVTAAGERAAEVTVTNGDDRIRRQIHDIVWSGQRYVAVMLQMTSLPCSRIVCPADHELQSIEFDSALTVSSPASVHSVAATAGSVIDADLATDGTEVLYLWSAFSGNTSSVDVWMKRGSGPATIIGTQAIAVKGVWDGSRYIVAWSKYAAEPGSMSVVVTPLGEPPSELGPRTTRFALAGGDGRTLIAYTRHLIPNPAAHAGTLERGFFRFTTGPARRRTAGPR